MPMLPGCGVSPVRPDRSYSLVGENPTGVRFSQPLRIESWESCGDVTSKRRQKVSEVESTGWHTSGEWY
jgi:hypothetical protein